MRARTAVVRRLAKLWRSIPEPWPWYPGQGEALRAMASPAGLDPDRVVRAAAILSPAVDWADVVRLLPAWLVDPDAPMPGYGRNLAKARAHLAGQAWARLDRRTGPKTWRFALNLSGVVNLVTVDRWALRAAGLPSSAGISLGEYRQVERDYQRAAEVVGTSPAFLQSATWTLVRGRA